MTAARLGVMMHVYQSIAATVGTREALELARRLAAWHDGMVMHQRRDRTSRGSACAPDCPHEEARSLWVEAVQAYGDAAHELRFLRLHGSRDVEFPAPTSVRLSA